MSDKEALEGDANRIKAWIHFKEGCDVDEDTHLLINDVKLLFDMIAERDAKIAELKESLQYFENVTTNQTLALKELRDKLSLVVDGLRSGIDHMRSKQSYDCVLLNKLNKTLKQIGETK